MNHDPDGREPSGPAAAGLTYSDAATYTGFGRTTLALAVQAGDLASIKVGKARRFLRSDLDAWLESKRAPAVQRAAGPGARPARARPAPSLESVAAAAVALVAHARSLGIETGSTLERTSGGILAGFRDPMLLSEWIRAPFEVEVERLQPLPGPLEVGLSTPTAVAALFVDDWRAGEVERVPRWYRLAFPDTVRDLAVEPFLELLEPPDWLPSVGRSNVLEFLRPLYADPDPRA